MRRLLVGNVAVAVVGDEIELVVGHARFPFAARVQPFRLGELFTQLINFASTRKARELFFNQLFNLGRNFDANALARFGDFLFGNFFEVDDFLFVESNCGILGSGSSFKVIAECFDFRLQQLAEFCVFVFRARGQEHFQLGAQVRLDLLDVLLNFNREMRPQFWQRINELFQLAALNDG